MILFTQFCKTRNFLHLFYLSFFILVLLFMAPKDLILVILRDEVANTSIVLVSLFLSFLLPIFWVSPGPALEGCISRATILKLRLLWFLFVSFTIFLFSVIFWFFNVDRIDYLVIILRNSMFSLAISWVAAYFLEKRWAWGPGLLICGLVWMFGTTTGGGDPSLLSLPNYPFNSIVAGSIAFLSWTLALIGFTLWGTRSERMLR